MYELDIERLQREWHTSYFGARRSGRTTQMLVEAIQNTIAKQEVIIIAHSYAYCMQLARLVQYYAPDMGYIVTRPGALHLEIDGVPLRFIVKDKRLDQKLRGHKVITFTDHYVEEERLYNK